MILRGDALSMLKTLPEASVQTCVTSPPYWGLRRYDIPDIVFDGVEGCEHEWGDAGVRHKGGPQGAGGQRANRANVDTQNDAQHTSTGSFCTRCGAWLGQLGQEPTPALFIAHMVEIFREVRRVLRDDGTCWLNMGDCYANDGKYGGETGVKQAYLPDDDRKRCGREKRFTGLKPKDLVGIPWMLAFALRDDGWYLRAENVWAKGVSFCSSWAGSVMPESVTDRPTRSHEQMFLLTKAERYFYDHEAVKEVGVYPAGTRAAKGSGTREGNRRGTQKHGRDKPSGHRPNPGGGLSRGYHLDDDSAPDDGYATYDGKRNLRTVWAIGVDPFTEAHFATFPTDLVDPCLRAGTSAKGACPTCGAPWERIIEYEPIPEHIKAQFEAARHATAQDHGRDDGFTTRRPNYQRKKIGEKWEPTCECRQTVDGEALPPEPTACVVMDPFAGSGTVGVATQLMGLQFIGIDLGYHDISERRIADVAPLFTEAHS